MAPILGVTEASGDWYPRSGIFQGAAAIWPGTGTLTTWELVALGGGHGIGPTV
jgi:hypothetical protein